MGAKVQSKTYFPGSMTDLKNGFHNGIWDPYHDDKSNNISGPVNGQQYDYFLMLQAMDGYTGYGKEQIRQTILKHESIFKHQLHELHRLYKRQRDLMNPVPAETSNLSHFLSQLPSDVSKGTRIFASSVPLVDSSFDNPFSPIGSIKGKSTLNDFSTVISKNSFSDRRVIDLELPAEVDTSNNRKQKVFNLADLNEPVQVEERETAFSAFFSNKNGTKYLAEESQKRDLSAKRTLFGVEIGESNQTPSFALPWRNTACVQNASTFHHNNHWLHSSDLTSQKPGFFAGNTRLTTSSTRQNYSAGFGFLNGINSKDSLSNSREEICAQEKHTFLDMWKNRETPEQTLHSWLTAKPCLQSEHIKDKEILNHHFTLDSLQNHSQQFFNKTEMTEGNDARDFKKLKTNNTQSITKILRVPITDKKVESKDIRHHIDLNLSLDEEDSPPSFPESIVKIATMEIDLEAPAVESDTDSGSMDNTHMKLVKVAAEAIVSVSICQPPYKPSADTLMWFAEVITSNDFKKSSEAFSEDMDYFEYMTLKLEDTKESYDSYKVIVVEEEQKEDDSGSLSKRTARKGQGRRGRLRKDFQKDILPSIVSLSRREVTEDLQIFEEVFSTTGVSWQSSLSKRKAAARNGRGRRRLVVADTSCNPTPPVAAAAVGGEKSICREMSLEKSLGGWGRRTRRLPRQRCQHGGNHNWSLALKC